MAPALLKLRRILMLRTLLRVGGVAGRNSSRYVSDIDPLPTKYGGKTNVTVLPGSGVGPEIMESTLRVLQAAQAPLSYEILMATSQLDSDEEFENALTSIRRNKIALKGNIETKSKNPYDKSRNIMLRKTLDLFAYVLYCKSYPGIVGRIPDVDITVVRQNTEGEYLMLEHEPSPGSAESLKVVTRVSSLKVAAFAFDYAVRNGRRKVTIVHGADVHPLSEGLFVEAALGVARRYPAVRVNVLETGVAVVKLTQDPSAFDVILANNLNGSMLSNILIGILGGPGVVTGTNFSDDGIAVFEPGARNKGTSLVGLGIANPLAMIMSGVNLLHHLGHEKAATIVQESVFSALAYDRVLTKDLGGKATTKELTEAIVRHIRKQLQPNVDHSPRPAALHKWKTYCPPPGQHPKEAQ